MLQVSKQIFSKALRELGYNPDDYIGKKLSLAAVSELYGLSQTIMLEAIEDHLVCAHYDYKNDTIWVDALEAAYFYYCLRSKTSLYAE